MTKSRAHVKGTRLVLSLACFSLASAAVEAMWSVPDAYVPIARLLANGEKYLETHPDDAEAHYRMARFHSRAYAWGDAKISIYGETSEESMPRGPGFDTDSPFRAFHKDVPRKFRLDHLGSAVKYYDRAIELAPGKALYWIGLAWVCEEATKYAPDFRYARRFKMSYKDTFVQDINTGNRWRLEALMAYRTAFELARTDPQNDRGPFARLIYYECAHAIKRILESSEGLSFFDKIELSRLERIIGGFERYNSVITPIIFSLGEHGGITELVSTDASTGFDLDGFDSGAVWPWLQADTALLVWDPDDSGAIKSGRQLFGSVTWWMFWETGYEALSALDDDSDGWLRQGELDGIAAWFDRNSNGMSDPGEVTPVAHLGIVGIAVQASGRLVTGEPFAAEGIEMRHGRRVPTYDWMPEALPARPRRPDPSTPQSGSRSR